ncbi:MAG: FAD-binding and (Fe-S)-binding domain-containing protein [Thiomicrospira sp.]|jgi:FAD/FMN-containing dehydrogenase/Fe-S oxidoreductase|nr:FAD-binding and (Fe-S)-binding domain-containing protein [Thiomicrospira sp.]
MLYSTDASVFEIVPKKVITPRNKAALIEAIGDAVSQNCPITLRAGGTSLGGQAIGSGLIIDVSKHLTQILDYQPQQGIAWVEPGVIQDDLNAFVAADGLVFAPDTSTSNRAMIGGMIGNNSCGSYSVYYGTTREHIEAVEVVLADGSTACFEPLSAQALEAKRSLASLEGDIYRQLFALLDEYGEAILANAPDASIIRRNTGYALDVLLRDYQPFNPHGKPFNLAPLICGSEGTLCAVSAAKVKLVPRPVFRQLLCAHFDSIASALSLVPALLSFNPAAIELIDKATLDGTLHNLAQKQNRFWIEGDPQAVLVIELFDQQAEALATRLADSQAWLLSRGAYAAPIIAPQDSARVWSLRKAGLGLLMGKRTRKKAVAVIEDAAVPVASLADFYADVQALMAEFKVNAVYYGHASVGVIHIRPELDLAQASDRAVFESLARAFSQLVKRYRGALSGEHGDGRIRAPFLREQVGDRVYQAWQTLKRAFDPQGVFNPGVILGEQSISVHHRADRQPKVKLTTGFDWRGDISLMDAVEKCNGAGACRKSSGLMCPSYQVTREEAYSTRGRSSLLRHALTEPNPISALSQPDLQQALALCLACKACKTECPASVDMARLKAEVLYQTKTSGRQAWLFRNQQRVMAWSSRYSHWVNRLQRWSLVKRLLGIDIRRDLPAIAPVSLQTLWQSQRLQLSSQQASHSGLVVWVLCDLYSQYQEPTVGLAVLSSLTRLGLEVRPIYLMHSPRALISQGLLAEAKAALIEIHGWLRQVQPEHYIVGIEPSEVLVWRDEARDLLPKNTRLFAEVKVKLYEELVLDLAKQGALPPLLPLKRKVWLHVHCHQKSLADARDVHEVLRLIPGLQIESIASGCCGMAGDFGYKQYDVSLKIAQQALLPAIEATDKSDWIVATGVSCRSQIDDLTQRQALHVAQVVERALSGAPQEE